MDDDSSDELSVNDKLRQLTDENSRLYKLLAEKDLEVKRIQNKFENEKSISGFNLNSGDAAAMKIIELSKKIREQNSEIEVEKNKVRQLQKKCNDYEKQLYTQSNKKEMLSPEIEKTELELKSEEIKSLQDKCKQSELKVSEYRNQIQSLKNELKVLNKVLSQEVGDNVPIQSLLNNPGSWKGRVQQISTLQRKITELKKQLEDQTTTPSTTTTTATNEDNEYIYTRQQQQQQQQQQQPLNSLQYTSSLLTINSTMSSSSSNLDERHKEKIKQIEKSRKDSVEKMKIDFKTMESDFNNLKQKHEALKARNQVLSNEVKTLKQQVQVLLEKGKHDDELVEALLKQQSQWKQALLNDYNMKKERVNGKNELNRSQQTDQNTIEQYKQLIADKEVKLIELERKLQDALRMKTDATSNNNNNTKILSANNPNISRDSTASPDSLNEEPQTIKQHQSTAAATAGDKTSNRSEYNELNALYLALTVERDKLNELVRVLESRSQQLTVQMTDLQSKLQSQLKTNASLEKQIGKLKLERGSSYAKISSGMGGGGDWIKQNDREELLLKLEIQKDEIEALKASLQSTLKSREEDMNVYTSMIEESRRIFIETLRKERQQFAGEILYNQNQT